MIPEAVLPTGNVLLYQLKLVLNWAEFTDICAILITKILLIFSGRNTESLIFAINYRTS